MGLRGTLVAHGSHVCICHKNKNMPGLKDVIGFKK